MHRPTLFILLFLALILVVGCGKGPGADSVADRTVAAGKANSGDEDPAVPVEVDTLRKGSIESVIRATSTLEAETRVKVVAEASRRVVEIAAEEGDRVRAGQLLARLQDAEQTGALARARTLFEQADREWNRQEALREKGLTTDKAYNDALAGLEQKRLDVKDAERELGYTRVRATLAGTVTQRMVRLGDQVQPGTELFEIVDFNSLVARIYVPEQDLGSLHPGQPARIRAVAVREDPFVAKVDRVAPVVDARTGTVKVTVDIGGQPGLRPGLYVDVELVTAREDDTLLVPKRAILYEEDSMFVFRIREGRAVRERVVPLMMNEDSVRPGGGFAAGDSVVVAGQSSLKDGARVEVLDREAGEGDAQ